MSSSPMVTVDTRRLYEDLRSLLYQPFRSAFLNRERKGDATRPSTAIEAATRHFLFELPETRREIQKSVDEHMIETRTPRSRPHNVYAPELLKSIAYDIGREAWTHRYDGPVQMELNVQSSRVTLHQICPPNAPIYPPP